MESLQGIGVVSSCHSDPIMKRNSILITSWKMMIDIKLSVSSTITIYTYMHRIKINIKLQCIHVIYNIIIMSKSYT